LRSFLAVMCNQASSSSVRRIVSVLLMMGLYTGHLRRRPPAPMIAPSAMTDAPQGP
jgi:hypothetical protein